MDRIYSELERHLPGDEDDVDALLSLVRDELGMDVVFVAQFTDGKQVYRATEGDAASFGIVVGDGPALETTYCQRVVDGVIPSVIPDSAADARVRDLPPTRDSGIGSYVGVPLRFSDGQVYGTFCCASREPTATLDERDATFMRLLGSVVASRLEVRAERDRKRREIEHLLAADASQIALQPIVTTEGGWCGAEALSRFALGRPDVVFEQAHAVGLGPELELAALRAAVAARSAIPDDVYLSVNVGPVALTHPGFADAVRSGSDLSHIVLEITEHSAIDDYDHINAVIAPLRREGLRLAIDDVGAGYASLRHIWRLAPEFIKVDRSMVDGISRDPAQRSIATMVVMMGLELGATVIAEGVEEPDDAEAVMSLGADAMQGYLYAPPTTDRTEWTSWSARFHPSVGAHRGPRELQRTTRSPAG